MNIPKIILLASALVAAGTLIAEPVKVIEFSGDYGSNSNSALGNAPDEFHFFEEADFNGDEVTDTRRYIPMLFPYPGIGPKDPDNPELGNHGPLQTNFQIDQDLFGVNGIFYTGAQVINYGAEPGVFPRFGLYRWAAGRQGFQYTSGIEGTHAPTADMGLLVANYVVKDFFLNDAEQTADLKLANQEGGFTAEVGFRGVPNLEVDAEAYRRARFFIRAGDTWYVSETSTPVEENLEKQINYTLSINPAAEYWYAYDEQTMAFVAEKPGTTEPLGDGVRGDSLSDISAAGLILQNTRFDGLVENHHIWLEIAEYVMYLDPNPDPVVETGGWTDTGAWLGWLYDDGSPWFYSLSLDKFIYLPEGSPGEAGGWVYVPAGS